MVQPMSVLLLPVVELTVGEDNGSGDSVITPSLRGLPRPLLMGERLLVLAQEVGTDRLLGDGGRGSGLGYLRGRPLFFLGFLTGGLRGGFLDSGGILPPDEELLDDEEEEDDEREEIGLFDPLNDKPDGKSIYKMNKLKSFSLNVQTPVVSYDKMHRCVLQYGYPTYTHTHDVYLTHCKYAHTYLPKTLSSSPTTCLYMFSDKTLSGWACSVHQLHPLLSQEDSPSFGGRGYPVSLARPRSGSRRGSLI